MSIAGNGNNPS